MCVHLDGLDPTIWSRAVPLHACSFGGAKRVNMRPSDAYAYHVRVGGHVGVVSMHPSGPKLVLVVSRCMPCHVVLVLHAVSVLKCAHSVEPFV